MTALESPDRSRGSEASRDDEPAAPAPVAAEPPAVEPPAAESPAPETAAGDAPEEPPSGTGGPVLTACLETGEGCTVINIAVLDAAAESCIELSVDDCGTFSRAGLPVETPVTWRLGSASVGELPEGGCIPGEYDSDSAIVVDGSGSIRWNLDTRRPSDVVVDVALETAGGGADAPVGIVGTFTGAVPDCDG